MQQSDILPIIRNVSKYIYKHIGDPVKYTTRPQSISVFFTIYYQIPIAGDRPGSPMQYGDVYDMIIEMNLVTYANKIRVNILEISPEEYTIGHKVYDPDEFLNVSELQSLIIDDTYTAIKKRFEDYEFIF